MRILARTTLGLAAAAGVMVSCNSPDKAAKPAEPAAAAAPAAAPAPAPAPAAEQPLTVERSARVAVTAKVKAVNYSTREVTLQGASGHATTVVAGPDIKRLNEVQVGDNVTVEYVVTLIAELRPATAEESANPIAAAAVTGRAPKGDAPAGAVAGGVRVVTTVEAVDLGKMLVKLKGPLGDTTTVQARNPDNVKKLHVGDTIVLTYIEAMALSLTKASKP